jgi:hypothetical protein
MAFISWLLSRNIGLASIAQGLVPLGATGTFAQLYGKLTGDAPNKAWPAFKSAVQGLRGGVTSDDPFNGAASVQNAIAALRPRSHRLLPPV